MTQSSKVIYQIPDNVDFNGIAIIGEMGLRLKKLPISSYGVNIGALG